MPFLDNVRDPGVVSLGLVGKCFVIRFSYHLLRCIPMDQPCVTMFVQDSIQLDVDHTASIFRIHKR